MPGRSWAPAPARSAGPATRPRGARVGRCRPDPRGARKATRHRRPSGELPRSGWSRPSQYALWTKWRARHRSVRDAEGPTRQHRVQEGRRRSKPHTGGQPSAAGAAAGGVKSTSTMRSSPPPRHDHGQRDLGPFEGGNETTGRGDRAAAGAFIGADDCDRRRAAALHAPDRRPSRTGRAAAWARRVGRSQGSRPHGPHQPVLPGARSRLAAWAGARAPPRLRRTGDSPVTKRSTRRTRPPTKEPLPSHTMGP
jgi:hypothetical protein